METLTTKSFGAAIESGATVIDFFAPWCRPCINFAPTFEKFAAEFAGKAKFYKVDIDQDPEIAANYGIMSIPTLLVFSNGMEVERKVGVMNEIDFRIWINRAVAA